MKDLGAVSIPLLWPYSSSCCVYKDGDHCYRMGTIELELYWKHAPVTCCNFAELSRRGYYNGLKFHRVIKDFMIQGGDPTGTGTHLAADCCLLASTPCPEKNGPPKHVQITL